MTHNDIRRSPEEVRTGGMHIDLEGADVALGDPEPWEPWETQLVVWSLGIGLVALVVLGVIINLTILN